MDIKVLWKIIKALCVYKSALKIIKVLCRYKSALKNNKSLSENILQHDHNIFAKSQNENEIRTFDRLTGIA